MGLYERDPLESKVDRGHAAECSNIPAAGRANAPACCHARLAPHTDTRSSAYYAPTVWSWRKHIGLAPFPLSPDEITPISGQDHFYQWILRPNSI